MVVQGLDPAGVGGRNLQECLSIQIKRKDRTVAIRTAEAILDTCFDEFTKKHYKKIIKKLDIFEDDLKEAIEEIKNLSEQILSELK